jgi:DNA polymerase-1
LSGLKHFFLIDGSGFIFRAFHALPPLTRPDGTPVGAVLGFCQMLTKLIGETDADAVAVIFDAGRKTFRNEIYPEYKANRPEAPEELVPQFALIRDATRAFSVPAVEMEGFEADDLIATYARQAAERGAEVTIVSADKDLMQVVSDGVNMLDPIRNRRIGPDEVRERFAVGPDRVVDVQALAGDSTDNVPGVPGIGVEPAAVLVTEYGDLEALLTLAAEPGQLAKDAGNRAKELEAKIYQLSGREFKINSNKELGEILFDEMGLPGGRKGKSGAYTVNTELLKTLAAKGHEIAGLVMRWRVLNKLQANYAEKLHDFADQAELSRELVRLRDDVPVPAPLESFAVKEPDPKALLAFLTEQDFKSIVARVQAKLAAEGRVEAPESREMAPAETAYELVQTEGELEAWVERAREAGVVAVDTETTRRGGAPADPHGPRPRPSRAPAQGSRGPQGGAQPQIRHAGAGPHRRRA